MYICKNKQLSDRWEVPNSWYKGERDWSIGGGNGEVIFVEITEFDLGLKGWLTCVWRKGNGGGHSSISSFSKFIWSLYCMLDTVLRTGHTVENKIKFLSLWALNSSGRRWRDSKQVNTTWKA